MAPSGKVQKPASGAKKVSLKGKNKALACGIMRYSKSQNFKRRAAYRFIGKKTKAPEQKKKMLTVTKKIGGASNGGQRVVKLVKAKAVYPTKPRVAKRPTKQVFKNHARNTRKAMTPGRVLIMLAGRHQAKRVVLLKVLKSGLLLVSGPFFLNGCPMRRVSQRYVIATRTHIDLGKFKVPANINDKYFKRQVAKKQKAGEGEIFATKKAQYVLAEQRKADQKLVDQQVREAIRKRKDKSTMYQYLKALFRLKSSQYPHRMQF